MNKKEIILNFISSDIDKNKIKKVMQSSLLKFNDPVKVSAQLSKILDGDIDILKENEVEEILKNIEGVEFKKSDNIQDVTKPNKSEIAIKTKDFKFDREAAEQIYVASVEETQALNSLLKTKEKEIEKLRIELTNEKEVRKKLENIIYLTKRQSLVSTSDDDINDLYLKYLESGEEQYQSAIVTKGKNTVIIPKNYYVIK